MSQTTSERLAELGSAALRPLVSRVLGETGIGFEKWQYEPVYGGFGGGINEAHRLYRVRGTAYTQGGLRPWSMILKVLSATDGSGEPGAWDFWKREALLYQSGLLDDLADGLAEG